MEEMRISPLIVPIKINSAKNDDGVDVYDGIVKNNFN